MSQLAFRVIGPGGRTIFMTDDWVKACWAALTSNWPQPEGRAEYRGVVGTHPTHDWDTQERRCRNCGAWDNGSYGSHAPCGYDWSHDSLHSALERERLQRDAMAQ